MNESKQERSPYRWDDRIAIAVRDGAGYAYRPGEVLARGPEAQAFVEAITGGVKGEVLGRSLGQELDRELFPPVAAVLDQWALFPGVGDVVGIVNMAAAAGLAVQPNHVLFADGAACGCGCPCPPHPSLSNDLEGLVGNPLKANPLKANPLKANPLKANPLKANPLKANSLAETQPPVSSAVPTGKPDVSALDIPNSAAGPRVVVFDSGIAAVDQRPAGFPAVEEFGSSDEPDTVHEPGDGYLDPVAGHGTFIAGIVEQLCPGNELVSRKVLGPLGDVSEVHLALALLRQIDDDAKTGNAVRWPQTLFNVSIGGYRRDDTGLLGVTVAFANALRIVIVASAGNLGACRPSYPAAFPTVIAVGALGPVGPAEFTNFGPWVDACAPGTDLISAFFADFDGKSPEVNGIDVDRFRGWAQWSGTSFAAPTVAAALTREMRIRGIDAQEAVAVLIDGPGRTRIPNLGTIVTI